MLASCWRPARAAGRLCSTFRGIPPPPPTTKAEYIGPNEASRRAAAARRDAAEEGVKVTMEVNGKSVHVSNGATILDACRAAGKHVPTLCSQPLLYASGPGNCRMCLVAAEGSDKLLPACSTPAAEGMSVHTETEEVVASRKADLKLLLQHHPNACMTCEADGNCELQDLVYRYDVQDEWPKASVSHEWDDDSSASVHRDMSKCIKCGRCITACSLVQEMDILSFWGRGESEMPVPGAGELLGDTPCISCGQCTLYCPVGALVPAPHHRAVAEAIEVKEERGKVHVACVAPSVRVALGEELGMEPGATTTGVLVAALRHLGFDYVFDTQFAADLCIMEEGSELVQRLSRGGPFPMFTSCCPGWVNLVEQSYPQWTSHLSTARSPQAMMSSVVKQYFAPSIGRAPTDVMVTSIMPCTAKKDEAARPQLSDAHGVPDTDLVLTTRELGRLLRQERVPCASLAPSAFDDPLGESTTAAALFGVTGGVMEAAVRTAHVLVTGEALPRLQFDAVRGLAGVKTATVALGDTRLRLAAINGTGATRRVLDAIAKGDAGFDFVEVMACPGGCIGGGGQPKSHDPEVLTKRMLAVYDADERGVLRMSHENPAVKALYDKFLDAPLSHTAHKHLHTHYSDRSDAHHHHLVRRLLPSEDEVGE